MTDEKAASATGGDVSPTREERLAAKLRENLMKRKQQARLKRADHPESDGAETL